MATIIRAQCAFGADMSDVRHRFVITPHFRSSVTTNWQNLADDLAPALQTWLVTPQREITVKLYDAQAPAPNYPKATKTVNLGMFPASGPPREMALCLSYKGGDGPRRRGRLYIPAPLVTPSAIDMRPTNTVITKAVGLASVLRGLGGADIEWGVYSRVSNDFTPTATAYVDNEWDVQRSRGLPPTAFTSAGSGS